MDGKPVEGAIVLVKNAGNGPTDPAVKLARSDMQGRYRIIGLTDGAFYDVYVEDASETSRFRPALPLTGVIADDPVTIGQDFTLMAVS
jgi:hypothetical protein